MNDWQARKEAQWQSLRDRLAAGDIALPSSEDLRKDIMPLRWIISDMELAMRYMAEGVRHS